MNQLYTHVQAVINEGSKEALDNIIIFLNQNKGQSSKQYGCGQNTFYTLRRLIGSSLARDPKLKQNSYNALISIRQNVKDLNQIKTQAFANFFLTITDPKDCKAQQEINAYIHGKINVSQILSPHLKHAKSLLNNLVSLCNSNENFQQELVEGLYVLEGDGISKLKLDLKDVNALFLYDIFLKKPIQSQKITEALNKAIESYPKQSIALKYLGIRLGNLSTPKEFFKNHYAQFLDIREEETEDGDLKKLYYLLQIQKYFFSQNEINKQNIQKYLCIQMIIVWLQQLRVKNKHMYMLASSIKIKFENDSNFCFEVLKLLHDKNIYLENISINHPLIQLYANVQPSIFWQYIVELCNKKDKLDEEDQEKSNKKQQYLSQLQFISRLKSENLSLEQIGESLTILIKAYQQRKKSEKLLNLVWSLFHHLYNGQQDQKKKKKKFVLNKKLPLILSKIKLNQFQLQSEIQENISKVIKFLRIKVKGSKDSNNKFSIAFLNLVTALIIYSIVYSQQSDICAEIQFISKDLEALVNQSQALNAGKDVVKKKVKKNQEAVDVKKPIHVLVDIFISLLTKAPIFLRTAINLMFQQLVPFLETADLDTLLDVIQKPDQEYIQQI